jgi:hypothetical protein
MTGSVRLESSACLCCAVGCCPPNCTCTWTFPCVAGRVCRLDRPSWTRHGPRVLRACRVREVRLWESRAVSIIDGMKDGGAWPNHTLLRRAGYYRSPQAFVLCAAVCRGVGAHLFPSSFQSFACTVVRGCHGVHAPVWFRSVPPLKNLDFFFLFLGRGSTN